MSVPISSPSLATGAQPRAGQALSHRTPLPALGKSSFCSFVYGWRGDYSGRIAFDGQDIRTLSASAWGRIRRESLSFLFQDMRLFGELTAWDNVWIKNQLTGHKDRQTIEATSRHSVLPTSSRAPHACCPSGSNSALPLSARSVSPSTSSYSTSPSATSMRRTAVRSQGSSPPKPPPQGASVIVTSVGKHLPLEYHHTYQL